MGLLYALLDLGVLTFVVLGQLGGETSLTPVVGGCIALLGALMVAAVAAAQVSGKPKRGKGGNRQASRFAADSGLRDP